jgi:hypothetical protein
VRTLVLVLVLVVGGASVRADDAPLPPLVSWRAPQGCGDELTLRRHVAELAGPSGSDSKAPYAVVEVEQTADGFTAHIDLSTLEGVTHRTRKAASCDELADSVAKLVAMAWRTALREPKLLDWHAPDECPDRLEVRGEIADRAHRRHDDGFAPFATVDVVKDDTGYVATVRLQAGQTYETREVRGPTCAEAADAVAWMIALAWVPKPPSPPPPPPPRQPPPPWDLRVAVRSSFDAGTLPGADAGLGLAVGVAHASGIEAELAGTWWAERFDPVMDGSSAGVAISLQSLAARVCVARWFACAGVEAGQIGGRAVELEDGRQASLPWLAATAGARTRYRMSSKVDAVLDAGIVVPLGRPQFTFDGGGVVFRPTPVAARLGLALEFAPFQ